MHASQASNGQVCLCALAIVPSSSRSVSIGVTHGQREREKECLPKSSRPGNDCGSQQQLDWPSNQQRRLSIGGAQLEKKAECLQYKLNARLISSLESMPPVQSRLLKPTSGRERESKGKRHRWTLRYRHWSSACK